jgi:phosphatidate cytidylyltransferase
MNNSTLKRLVTAVILAPLVLLCLYFSNFLFFSVVSSFIILIALMEWTHFFNFNSKVKGFYLLLFFIGFFGLFLFNKLPEVFIWSFLSLVSVLWLFVPFLFRKYALGKFSAKTDYFSFLSGFLVLSSAWLSWQLLFKNYTHALPFIYLLFLVWVADVFAYFFGKKWGKTKLIPHISPGKTWEGLWGAMFFSFIFALGISILFFKTYQMRFIFILISLITVGISVIGDLFISLLKRQHNLKDTGNLLPGHGGILDRIDSLLSSSPVFIVLLWVSGWNLHV